MRLGIFGGTFDPPHIGHLILADEAMNQLCLDRVLWVLTPEPPHKSRLGITCLNYRLKMINPIIKQNPDFELSKVDMDRNPPYYAVDSVRLLREEYPRDNLIFLLGGDSLENLPFWHKPIEFVHACLMLGVMRRTGATYDLDRLNKKIPGIKTKIFFIDTPIIDISASNIRERIRQNLPFRYYLHPSVHQIIKGSNLYINNDYPEKKN